MRELAASGRHNGESKHQPPDAFQVPEQIEELCDYVNQNWHRSALHLASYVMWKLNWIHPFTDGNGRTSRAASYLILCVRMGYLLPGRLTIPEQIEAVRLRTTGRLRLLICHGSREGRCVEDEGAFECNAGDAVGRRTWGFRIWRRVERRVRFSRRIPTLITGRGWLDADDLHSTCLPSGVLILVLLPSIS